MMHLFLGAIEVSMNHDQKTAVLLVWVDNEKLEAFIKWGERESATYSLYMKRPIIFK